MPAINAPKESDRGKTIPEQAMGNPVYEQTRQDMPLWCCGHNCGRNSRITVFILGVIGICASTIVCLSPNYFRFVALRNDTFSDDDKRQPIPFEYATEANVGLFRYEILDVFEYPWPPEEQRQLFDAMHNRELERLAQYEAGQTENSDNNGDFFDRMLAKFPQEFFDDDDGVRGGTGNGGTGNTIVVIDPSNPQQNDTDAIVLTREPTAAPGFDDDYTVPEILPGSNVAEEERLPTSSPTSSPTMGNPNDKIDVEIGVVLPYPAGNQLDKLFRQGQNGAMWAPILAFIGLIFCAIEFFCCIYKCSWLPTAIFLYIAFMMQLMTLFLFMSEDFCEYAQDCWLGSAGYMSVIAVICYFICQILVCSTPRPPPKYNLLKKPPVRRKKRKKKKRGEFDDSERDSSYAGTSDRFHDDPSDPYSSQYGSSRFQDDPYGSHYGDTNSYSDDQDPYNSQYGDSSFTTSDAGFSNDPKNEFDTSGYDDNYAPESYDAGYDDGYGDQDYEDAPSSSRRSLA